MAYTLNRRQTFTRFLDDGRICMSDNAAERAVTVCGLDSGGQRAAVIYT